MSSNVSSVYIHVIDDVIGKVREDFISYGVGESVLAELQALWEAKMMQSGAISGSLENRTRLAPAAGGGGGAPIVPVHDLNVPYEGSMEEYETPTAEMLFPPTPLQTPSQTPLPGMVDYNIPTGGSDFGTGNDGRGDVDMKAGIPSPYMPPPSPWMNQRPLGVDVNVAYVEGREELDRGASQQPPTQDFFMMSSGKRKRDDYASRVTSGGYIPQQDGSGDVTIEFVLPKESGVLNSCRSARKIATAAIQSNKETSEEPVLPQVDGINDEFDNLFPYDGVATEDYNAVNTPADHVEHRVGTPSVGTPSVGTPKIAKSEALDDDEPPLNEDDDDDDDLDEAERGEEEPLTQHLVLAQFDKVTRTKSRWKCNLKDGIMHINSREMLFNKANGEFDF